MSVNHPAPLRDAAVTDRGDHHPGGQQGGRPVGVTDMQVPTGAVDQAEPVRPGRHPEPAAGPRTATGKVGYPAHMDKPTWPRLAERPFTGSLLATGHLPQSGETTPLQGSQRRSSTLNHDSRKTRPRKCPVMAHIPDTEAMS